MTDLAERVELLLRVKYDRDFYLTGKSWQEYLTSIGCLRNSGGPGFNVSDPEPFYKGEYLVHIPEELGMKALVLGGFP